MPYDYELILFGDNQEGNILQYRDGYKRAIDYVLSAPNRFAIHMGDEQEAYYIDDPRYHPFILQTSPLEQQERVIEDLNPLAEANRLEALLLGNHTWRLFPKVGDITQSTCKKLGVNYGTFSCVINFIDSHGIAFKGYFTHGHKSIRSIADDPVRRLANEQLQLKQHLKHKMGDCVLMAKGHTHRLIISEPKSQLYLHTDGDIKQSYTTYGGTGYIHPDHRWYVNTGSFLRTMGENISGYAEMAEYDPVELGFAVVEVHDRKITNIRKVTV